MSKRQASSCRAPGVELIDLLTSDVDLNGGQGEPTHGGEGLNGAQKSAVSPIHPVP